MNTETIKPGTNINKSAATLWENPQIESALSHVAAAHPSWSITPLQERAKLFIQLGKILRQQQDQLATLITQEMGKLFRESRAEVEKCALACDYYAAHAEAFLANKNIASDASNSYISYQPLGTLLAIMPWNFPLWQVMRFAIPALIGGNTAVLKHASNVPQCALAIEQLFIDADFPNHVFRSLMISSTQVSHVIEDPRIAAVTLTGSETAGRHVAANAGKQLKKTVLELGGSDAFILLEDAKLEQAVNVAVTSRFLNAGQSCIAAKRFIVVDSIADEFVAHFSAAAGELKYGDPMDAQTTLAPMARHDLRDELQQQVEQSIAQGALAVLGCHPVSDPGAFYPASILDQVKPGMPAYDDELFGPVASIIRVRDEQQAIEVANQSRFGLGGSVWTQDSQRGENVARQMQCGAVFINGLVKSDPRLPFGGIKASGYGRELSYLGLHEFQNAKTIWLR